MASTSSKTLETAMLVLLLLWPPEEFFALLWVGDAMDRKEEEVEEFLRAALMLSSCLSQASLFRLSSSSWVLNSLATLSTLLSISMLSDWNRSSSDPTQSVPLFLLTNLPSCSKWVSLAFWLISVNFSVSSLVIYSTAWWRMTDWNEKN